MAFSNHTSDGSTINWESVMRGSLYIVGGSPYQGNSLVRSANQLAAHHGVVIDVVYRQINSSILKGHTKAEAIVAMKHTLLEARL
jgi:hypothetical protein